MLETVYYKGYVIKENQSVCDDDPNYWSIYEIKGDHCYKWINVALTLYTALLIVDERIDKLCQLKKEMSV